MVWAGRNLKDHPVPPAALLPTITACPPLPGELEAAHSPAAAKLRWKLQPAPGLGGTRWCHTAGRAWNCFPLLHSHPAPFPSRPCCLRRCQFWIAPLQPVKVLMGVDKCQIAELSVCVLWMKGHSGGGKQAQKPLSSSACTPRDPFRAAKRVPPSFPSEWFSCARAEQFSPVMVFSGISQCKWQGWGNFLTNWD